VPLKQQDPLRRPLKLVSYNIHSCVGSDRRPSLARVATVLNELVPDVVALQEVAAGSAAWDAVEQAAMLGALTGLQHVDGPTLHRAAGRFGNVILTRLPVKAVRRHDLSHGGNEPRGALDVDLDWNGHRLRVMATHLGLRARERGRQVRALAAALCDARAERPDRATLAAPVVVMGDFNEWLPVSPRLFFLWRVLGRGYARASFPAQHPLLALDRIWIAPRGMRRGAGIHRSGLARLASDHLPVWMTIA
jgi:endonuclease/exonuclease/phosphatase family metal-dependent hydrolase